MRWIWPMSLQERPNERYGVSNHRHPDCLVSRLFRRTSTKTSKLRVTGLCEWNPPVTAHSPHKGPVMRKKFPFDNVITKYGMRFWSPEWLHQTALFHQQEQRSLQIYTWFLQSLLVLRWFQIICVDQIVSFNRSQASFVYIKKSTAETPTTTNHSGVSKTFAVLATEHATLKPGIDFDIERLNYPETYLT